MYIFLSHSSKNADIAKALCSHIEANGHQCFIAPRDIRTGFEYASELINGIDRSDAMILLLSSDSVQSPHVLREIERAVSKAIPIVVYKLEDVVLSKSMEYFLMTHQWMDANHGNYMDVINCLNGLTATLMPKQVATPVGVAGQTVTSGQAVIQGQAVTSGQVVVQGQEVAPVAVPGNVPVATPVATPTIITQTVHKNSFLPAVVLISAIIIALSVLAGVIMLSNNKDDNNTTTNRIEADNTTGDEKNTSSDETDKSTSEVVTDEPTSETSTDETTSGKIEPVKYNIGDTIVFGKYNDADIQWRVLRISEDGKEAILITDSIITIKGYDAADTGRYSYYEGVSQYSSDAEANTNMYIQADVWGNSSWELSTIRTWLNSSSKYVTYGDQLPSGLSFAGNSNAYDKEAGFLYGFTEEEQAAILTKDIVTKGNIISESEYITTSDKVFLLSLAELEWFKDTTISLFAKPTSEAIAKNQGTYYKDYCLDTYKTEELMWWLRDPVDRYSSRCHMVSIERGDTDTMEFYSVGVEEFGIRPAITVDLTSPVFVK